MSHLYLSYSQRQQLFDDATAGFPDEICGLIAGKKQTASQLIAVSNVASDPTHHYIMDNMGLLRALKHIDAEELVLLGFYHTHPTGLPIPSEEDIRAAAEHNPGMIQLIIAPQPSQAQPDMKAWIIQADHSVDCVDLLLPGHIPDNVSMSSAQMNTMLLVAALAFIILILISLSLLPPAPSLT